MLEAVIRGKVSSAVRRQEDVLTSCVFGTLDLLPARLGLAPWLRGARNLEGASLELGDEVLDRRRPSFWPRYPLGEGETVEPDLVLDCGELILVIEAKYGAGPSGMPNKDEGRLSGQLGRQWEATRAAKPDHEHRLIYVTADWSMPRDGMEAMVSETEGKREPTGMRARLYWLSWRSLAACLPVDVQEPRHARAVEGLRTLLRNRGLDMFRGITPPPAVSRPPWSYGYACSPGSVTITWNYERSETG